MDQKLKRPDCKIDRFSSDPGMSWTMPARLYFDPDVLEQERRDIFWRSWSFVCHRSDVARAGQYVTAEICGQRVFVIRGRDHKLRGFFNVCQHRGHSLLKGRGEAKPLLVCPYHAWSFDHKGSLKAAPNCDHVDGFDRDEFALPEVQVEEFCGFVFVNLDPAARSMADVYPGAEAALKRFCSDPEKLIPGRSIPFELAGNWKNVGDNLLECYHCGPAHKAFVDLVEMPTYQVETHEYWSIQHGHCRCQNQAYDFKCAGGDQDSFMTLYLWPNLAFVKFPGAPGVATFHFVPTAPEVTFQSFAYYQPEADLSETEQAALDYFQNVLGPEDVGLVEDVQVGLHSLAYHQGRFMVDDARSELSEHAAHHFQNLVMRELGLLAS